MYNNIFSKIYVIKKSILVVLNGFEFEFAATVIKYLGLHLDSKLNCNQHNIFKKTAEKCTNILFAARKMVGSNWGLDPDI